MQGRQHGVAGVKQYYRWDQKAVGFHVIVLGSEMGQCLRSMVRKVSCGRWALSRLLKEAGAPSWVNQGDTCQDTESRPDKHYWATASEAAYGKVFIQQ